MEVGPGGRGEGVGARVFCKKVLSESWHFRTQAASSTPGRVVLVVVPGRVVPGTGTRVPAH
eukprot:578534-Rhodomonas_salina.1